MWLYNLRNRVWNRILRISGWTPGNGFYVFISIVIVGTLILHYQQTIRTLVTALRTEEAPEPVAKTPLLAQPPLLPTSTAEPPEPPPIPDAPLIETFFVRAGSQGLRPQELPEGNGQDIARAIHEYVSARYKDAWYKVEGQTMTIFLYDVVKEDGVLAAFKRQTARRANMHLITVEFMEKKGNQCEYYVTRNEKTWEQSANERVSEDIRNLVTVATKYRYPNGWAKGVTYSIAVAEHYAQNSLPVAETYICTHQD